MNVVTGVRVGDVLHGTRTLRRWLRAAATEANLYIRYASGRDWEMFEKEGVYAPRKDDKFVVLVNHGRFFIVFSSRRNLIIPFVNPKPDGKDLNPGVPVETKMDGALFSQWFIRTPERFPRVDEWPPYARYIWACAARLHTPKNGWTTLDTSMPHGPLDPRRPDNEQRLLWNHHQVFQLHQNLPSQVALPTPPQSTSMFRNEDSLGTNIQGGNASRHGMGPGLRDLRILEENIPLLHRMIKEREEQRAARRQPMMHQPAYPGDMPMAWLLEKSPMKDLKAKIKKDLAQLKAAKNAKKNNWI